MNKEQGDAEQEGLRRLQVPCRAETKQPRPKIHWGNGTKNDDCRTTSLPNWALDVASVSHTQKAHRSVVWSWFSSKRFKRERGYASRALRQLTWAGLAVRHLCVRKACDNHEGSEGEKNLHVCFRQCSKDLTLNCLLYSTSQQGVCKAQILTCARC